MSVEARVIESARRGKFLAHKCAACGLLRMPTTYYCPECGGKGQEEILLDGSGEIATYTIITVPPAGFEKHVPYAFAVLSLDGADMRISGFVEGIATPADLPVGSRARIAGFDERGIIISRQ